MKLIIAGGRNGILSDDDFAKLDAIEGVTEVVSGGCRGWDQENARMLGVDAYGEVWAQRRGLPVKVFRAPWATYGKAAGPIRNQQMADYADALAVFAGGRGTADMVRRAQARGLQIFDFRK